MLRTLITTADDFGLATDINIAVESAHRNGFLSAASLMISGPAATDAIERALLMPRLSVGLHVVLVDGAPTLAPDRIPDLLDGDVFRRDLVRLGLDIATKPKVRTQLREEIRAQFIAFVESGLTLNHVDVHKHFHLHPIVGSEIIAVARDFGIQSLRVPYEPRSTPRLVTENKAVHPWILWPCVSVLRWQARRAGLFTADAVYGLSLSGRMNAEHMLNVISHASKGEVIEIYCHPAIGNEFDGHVNGYDYRGEFEALLSPVLMKAIYDHGFSLGSYNSALMALNDARFRRQGSDRRTRPV